MLLLHSDSISCGFGLAGVYTLFFFLIPQLSFAVFYFSQAPHSVSVIRLLLHSFWKGNTAGLSQSITLQALEEAEKNPLCLNPAI